MSVTIKIIDRHGAAHEVDAPADMNLNLMELIRIYELAPEGSIGICGGMAMCASCQIYINNSFPLPEKSQDEDAMLWEAFKLKENSRLACQIQITPDLDGLEFVIAPEA